MRKRRRTAGNSVFIDLTSLLDVIFILLLVVLCSYNYEKQKNEQAAEASAAAISDAEASSRAYSDMIETQNDLQKYVWAASIVVPYEPDKITTRHIKVLTEDKEIISIDLVGNDMEGDIEEFRDSLTDYVRRHPDRPVILSLNEKDDRILYRDETAIKEILDELMNTYDNVYIKGIVNE